MKIVWILEKASKSLKFKIHELPPFSEKIVAHDSSVEFFSHVSDGSKVPETKQSSLEQARHFKFGIGGILLLHLLSVQFSNEQFSVVSQGFPLA